MDQTIDEKITITEGMKLIQKECAGNSKCKDCSYYMHGDDCCLFQGNTPPKEWGIVNWKYINEH